VRLDLCHVGIVPAILSLDPSIEEAEVYACLQRKDVPGLVECLRGARAPARDALLALVDLYGEADGPESVIARGRALLPSMPGIGEALDTLERLARSPLLRRYPEVEISVDLADLRGYRYHSAITFAAYVDAIPNAVARGGRYDDIGRAFGRARPATGFSLELRELASLAPVEERAPALRAPWSDDPVLAQRVAELRAAGEIVLRTLPGHEHEQLEFACDRELVFEDGVWKVHAI